MMATAAPTDLSGDGKSDLIFRNNSTGEVNAWLMNGGAAIAQAGLLGAGNWTVTHTADFNGDGKADILWRNDDGTIVVWLMDGLSVVSSATLLGAASGWTVTHTADFNGDGKADLVFRHTDGRIAMWLMSGTTLTSGAGLLEAASGWTVTHTADFNGDGKADLVFRHSDGRVAMWLMSGLTLSSGAGLLDAGSGWSVTHTADFDGDGKADIAFRHTDGRAAIWLMNGSTLSSGAGVMAAASGWSVTHTGDFNGDGKADLAWRHADGRIAIWLMNGTTLVSGGGLPNVGASWSVTHTGDYNGDGKADLVLRNNSDGSITMWIMNGIEVINPTAILGPSPWVVLPASAVGAPTPATVQPTLIEATTYSTFNCPDKYCLHLTGFNFAANSYVEVWRGDTEFLGALTPFVRSKNGEADFVEVLLNTAAMKSAVVSEVPQFRVFIVNPGSTPAKDGPKQVYRTGVDNAIGYVDNYAGVFAPAVSGAFIQGWACFNNRPGVTVRFRQGSVSGPTVGTTFANLPGNTTVGGLCGGNGSKYFNWRWPDIYRDGQTRQVYASIDLGEFMNAVPNNILILNSPLTVTLPDAPRKAQFLYIQAPDQMISGITYRITVAYKNIGSVTWTSQDKFSLGQLTTNVWGNSYLPLQQSPVPPGYNGLFSFDVIALANQGNYLMQWSMIQEGIEWFGDWTVPKFIAVAPRASSPTPTQSPNQKLPPLVKSPIPYGQNPSSDPVLVSPPLF